MTAVVVFLILVVFVVTPVAIVESGRRRDRWELTEFDDDRDMRTLKTHRNTTAALGRATGEPSPEADARMRRRITDVHPEFYRDDIRW